MLERDVRTLALDSESRNEYCMDLQAQLRECWDTFGFCMPSLLHYLYICFTTLFRSPYV